MSKDFRFAKAIFRVKISLRKTTEKLEQEKLREVVASKRKVIQKMKTLYG